MLVAIPGNAIRELQHERCKTGRTNLSGQAGRMFVCSCVCVCASLRPQCLCLSLNLSDEDVILLVTGQLYGKMWLRCSRAIERSPKVDDKQAAVMSATAKREQLPPQPTRRAAGGRPKLSLRVVMRHVSALLPVGTHCNNIGDILRPFAAHAARPDHHQNGVVSETNSLLRLACVLWNVVNKAKHRDWFDRSTLIR